MVERAFLIVDGDDTLWENNVYFEQAIEVFTDFLAHSSLSREQVRATLDEIELLNIRVHGYGSAAFARNLRQCYERLAQRDIRKEDLDHVMALGKRIVEQPMKVLPGVAETVAYLAGRHELTLFTKGELEEQRLKVQRSGLEPHFDRVAVVAEKDADAYRRLVDEHGFDPAFTWMIGNSPKSDINPALKAGLNAVFIPHTHTWRLEAEDIPGADGRLLVLERFSQLRDHF
jgi:putative hydrolase of the HAD superfamily